MSGVLAAGAVSGSAVFAGTEHGGAPVSAGATTALGYDRSAAGDVSRSGDRPSLTALKAAAMADAVSGVSSSHGTTEVQRGQLLAADADPRDIARAMLPQYGWSESEFSCLDALWIGESNWNVYAENPYSGAYGIPQALPGDKMAVVGADWQTNPATQIEWGLDYIQSRYGSPCSAESFKVSSGWY